MKQVATWPSFETLRVKHAEQLSVVEPGTYARLNVKHRAFVVMNAADFEQMVALRADLELLALNIGALEDNKSNAPVKCLMARIEKQLEAQP